MYVPMSDMIKAANKTAVTSADPRRRSDRISKHVAENPDLIKVL